jgi:hypothetical protein
MGVINATPWPFYPSEWPSSRCTVGWVGPRAGLDGCAKIPPSPAFDSWTVQPVASPYVDYAIPVPHSLIIIIIIIIIIITVM